MTSTNFELVQLDDVDLIKFTREQNGSAWRGSLTPEQYIERESVLGKSKMATKDDNKLLVFMLRDKSDTSKRLCSIELLIRKSWVYKYVDNAVQRKSVLSGCIGGVFTYPEHRGKGYAAIMVDELVHLAKSKLLGPDGFVFLYSEVGEYYTRNGFKSFAVPLVKVPIGDHTSSPPIKFDHTYELLHYKQFEEILDIHNSQFNAKLAQLTATDFKSRVALDPTVDIVDWFHLRAKFISSKLFYKDNFENLSNLSYDQILEKFHKIDPDIFGIKSTSDGKFVGGIIWTYDWSLNEETNTYENKATILKIIVDEKVHVDDITKDLILKMKLYLESENTHECLKIINQFVLWESEVSEEVLSWLTGNLNATRNHENGSRSAILMNNDSDDKDLKDGNLIWEGNDKLPWF
ncbi:hypothetical protein CAAN3_15S03906 [[Candida] anglica]